MLILFICEKSGNSATTNQTCKTHETKMEEIIVIEDSDGDDSEKASEVTPRKVNAFMGKHGCSFSEKLQSMSKRKRVQKLCSSMEEELPDIFDVTTQEEMESARNKVCPSRPTDKGNFQDKHTYSLRSRLRSKKRLVENLIKKKRSLSPPGHQSACSSLQDAIVTSEVNADNNRVTRYRICSERQAYSSPIKMGSSLICVTPPVSPCEISPVVKLYDIYSPHYNSKDLIPSSNEFSMKSDTGRCERWVNMVLCSHKPHLLCRDLTNSVDDAIPVHEMKSFIEQENTVKDDRTDTENSILDSTYLIPDLERNAVFGSYSSVFLPGALTIKEDHNTKKLEMGNYHKQFIDTALEDQAIDSALSFLNDFVSKYSPVDITTKFISAWTEGKSSFVGLHQDRLFCVLTSSIQHHPEAISISTGQLFEALSSAQEEVTSLCHSAFSFLLIALETDLYTRNFCDDVKLRHSLAHQILSWNKGRHHVVRIIQCISSILKGRLSNNKVTLMFHLQHLLAMGLDASVGDEFNAVQNFAVEMKRVYFGLSTCHKRQLFISSVQKPQLTLLLTRTILEEKYNAKPSVEQFPTLNNLVKNYFGAVMQLKSISQVDAETICEEIAMLLYFLVWSSIECTKYRVREPKRSRVLDPGLSRTPPVNFGTDDLYQCLQSWCPFLSLTTYQYLMLIECLFSTASGL